MAKKIAEAKEKELHITEVRMLWEKKGWTAVYEHRNHKVHGLVIAVTMKKAGKSIFLCFYPDWKKF